MTSRITRPSRRALPLVAAMLLVVLAGCAGGAAGSPAAGGDAPTISGAWVRPPMGPDRPAGGYLTIAGGAEPDALVGAASPIATSVEIHETVADESGMAAMHPVHGIDVPAGATVRLEPGGYHLMLMGITDTLVPGETVELTLTFESAGPVTIQAEIRPG